jgi:aminopeptidase
MGDGYPFQTDVNFCIGGETMPKDFERKLEKYADVIVKVGLNLQPGQRLLIIGRLFLGYPGVSLELVPLVRAVTRQAYQAGARLVDVMWNDDQLVLSRYEHAPRDSFGETLTWRINGAIDAAEAGDAILLIYAEDPDLLQGQDGDLISTTGRAGSKLWKPFTDLRGKRTMNLAIVTAPVQGAAKKIFPDDPPESRVAMFWETLFKICRIDAPDPVKAWQDHVSGLIARREYLNEKQYSGLKLIGPETDLSLGLPRGHVWQGANLTTQSGIDFVTNIPTEEVFTLPHRGMTEGVVASSRPAATGMGLIDGFSLTFSEGRVIKATAKKGEDTLMKTLEMDEGARRLGEVALVPHSSPISQSGLLFYNILLDENASSHLALGNAYRFSIEGGEAMTNDEFAAVGGNQSVNHVDFMIGSEEMDVDGICADGTSEPIMRSGEWAFDV